MLDNVAQLKPRVCKWYRCEKAVSNYWVAFLIVMGISNLAGFGVIAYLKHEQRKDSASGGQHKHGC